MSDSSSWDPPPQPYGQQPYGQQPPYGAPPRTEGLAVASLVLGIVGLVGCLVVAPVLAIIFGLQAKAKISQNPSALQGAGMAQAGFVLGIIGCALDVVYIAWWASL
jgi:hypothetical protein